MKSAFGATLIFQIVIFFIIVFTGYLCISINQAKAFNVKNDVVKIIERNAPDLDTSAFRNQITESLEKEGYRTNGDCEDGWVGYDREGKKTSSLSKSSFCVRRIDTNLSGSTKPAMYYQVQTFYHLEIPILQSVFKLSANGETKLIYNKRVK